MEKDRDRICVEELPFEGKNKVVFIRPPQTDGVIERQSEWMLLHGDCAEISLGKLFPDVQILAELFYDEVLRLPLIIGGLADQKNLGIVIFMIG